MVKPSSWTSRVSDSENVTNLVKSCKLLKGQPGHSYIIFLTQSSHPDLPLNPCSQAAVISWRKSRTSRRLCKFMVSNLSWPFNTPQHSLILSSSCISHPSSLLSACSLTSCSTKQSKPHKAQYLPPLHWRLLTTWVTLRTSESSRHAQATSSFWECGHFQIWYWGHYL